MGKEETAIESQRRIAREANESLSHVDRANVSSVLQSIGHATVHLASGQLFYAGRYHCMAECTMRMIDNDEARGMASGLCDVVRIACQGIERKIVDATRYGKSGDEAMTELISCLVGSKEWCAAVDEGVETKLRLRHAELVASLAKRKKGGGG